MSTRDGARPGGPAVPLVAAATTWVAMLSWRPFTELPGRFLAPLAAVGLVVVGTGLLGRWRGLPTAVVVGLQVVAGGAITSMLLAGRAVPVGAGWTRLELVLQQAVESANQYAAPVPASAPGIHPLLVVGGLACFLLVDVLAATLRRVSLAGLPLLTILSVPVSLVGDDLPWWVFALTAGGFLLVLFLHESEELGRWGRPLAAPVGSPRPDVRPRRARATAGLVGAVATALAIVLPVAVPTLDVHLVDFGPGSGDDDITLSNPMTDLKRDLVLREDVPVLRLRTTDPAPSYLRTTALTLFRSETWSAGKRQVPVENLADGALPPLVGVGSEVERRTFDYDVQVFETFESDWLPTMAASTRVEAAGDWRFDVQTRDFLAADDDLDTAGLAYSMTSAELEHDAVDLARATTLGNQVSSVFTELPADLPAEVRDLAVQVTRAAPTRFEKAVALQRWFRETGGFTYSTDREPGTGTSDLVAFLRSDGRVGYCEQFSAAMAVMARVLGIPARVAVGFLQPERVGADTWEFSTHDLHAWPELFFPGSGWVRFEPTPAQRAPATPGWTRQDVPAVDPVTGAAPGAGGGPRSPDRVDATEAPRQGVVPETVADGTSEASGGRSFSLLAGLAVPLAAVLLLLPRTLRARRRERRRTGGPEAAWAELRDTALDLGLAWPEHRSPRETRDWLVPRLQGAPDRDVAVRALDRVVATLERLRYSAGPAADVPLTAEVRTLTENLREVAAPRARRRADWWPRSLLAPATVRETGTAEAAGHGRLVDHVGA